MRSVDCDREAEVLDAIASGCWPERSDEALRRHVAGCPSCADLVMVVSALEDDRRAARAEAHVPPSGAVWWRAQRRARQEALQAAARPITVAHVVAMVAALVAAAAVTIQFPWTGTVLAWLSSWGPSWSWSGFEMLDWSLLRHPAVILALGTWLVIGPVALYLLLARD